MLIGIDIGNTDITFGLFQGKKLLDTFRMRSKVNRTSDEYGMLYLIQSILGHWLPCCSAVFESGLIFVNLLARANMKTG